MSEYEAGRELDARVAAKVMGWQRCHAAFRGGSGFPPGQSFSIHNITVIPLYSTDIAAAWQVVEHMAHDFMPRVDGFSAGGTAFLYWWQRAHLWTDTGPDAAARICRAALAIMDGRVPV